MSQIKNACLRCELSYSSDVVEDIWKTQTNPIFKDVTTRPFVISTAMEKIGFVMVKDDVCYITFKGTTNLTDFTCDINFDLEEIKLGDVTCKVHKGVFHRSVILYEQIKSFISSSEKIEVSGHSLGGAIATMISAFIKTEFNTKFVSLITFGCIRTGDAKFADYIDKNINEKYRIIVHSDPIPEFPYKKEFKHCLPSIEYYKKNDFKIKYRDTFWLFRKRLFFWNLCHVKNHMLNTYIMML